MDKERRSELKQAYKNKPQKIGIFQITNLVSGKIFIGGTSNLDKVFNRHQAQLKFGSHPNKELQNDWNQSGPANFTFEILDELKPNEDPDYNYNEDLKTLEELWLEKLQPYGEKGYHKKK
ncbi:MAG: GIY-YIG nuclease family protein [Bacillota bacterium]